MAFYKYKGKRIRASDKSLVYRFCCGSLLLLFVAVIMLLNMNQLMHRQKLTHMVLEDGWYEAVTTQENSFFTDLQSGKSKEKISYFPRMYYRMEKGLLHIQSLVVIKCLMSYIKKHDFTVFGWYRIALGILVLLIIVI